MALTTYGEHAEASAQALNALVSLGSVPDSAAGRQRTLWCREALLDALQERLTALGARPEGEPALLDPTGPARAITVSLREPAEAVNTIALALPRLPREDAPSPTDYLGGRAPDPITETWRYAAVEALAASHALTSSPHQEWRLDDRAGWWLMKDIATSLEAVLVLDQRFQQTELLQTHGSPPHAPPIDRARLLLSHAARTATLLATDPSPDDLVAQPRRPDSGFPGPTAVAMVNSPADLAHAQTRVTALLRGSNLRAPHITADEIRLVCSSQLFLCRAFAQIAASSPRCEPLVEVFTSRAEALEALVPQVSYLINRVREPQNRTLHLQQSELTTAVKRMQRREPPRMSPSEVVELARTTHHAVAMFQKRLHRELTYLEKSTSLRFSRSHPDEERPWIKHRVIARDAPIVALAAKLGELTWTDVPVAKFSAPAQRAALAHALDVTAHDTRRPHLFSPGRRSTASHAPAR